MSWSLTFIGKPENVVTALEEQSTKLDGQSKVEFDSALPYMVGLVKQNFNKSGEPVVKITASGHAYKNNDEPVYSQCSVTIENLNGTLV